MKKITFLLILVSFLLTYNLYAQKTKTLDNSKYRILYNYQFQRDSTDANNIKTATMELLIGNRYAIFQSLNHKFNDSLRVANEAKIKSVSSMGEVQSLMSERKKAYIKYKILKQKNNITVYEDFLLSKYKYNETVKFNWKILKDTLNINSYKCNKATTNFAGRDYIAWFTREIPISEGPYKFNGLPGLIIKIYDVKKHHIFELTSFTKKRIPINLYKNVTSITRQLVNKKQYYDAVKNYKKDPEFYHITVFKAVITNENRQKTRKFLLQHAKRFKANPIELKP